MFRFSLALFLICTTTSVFSQIKPKKEDWFAYDLTHNLLLDVPEGYEQWGWSHGHSFSFTGEMLFGTSNFGFGYGIGYTSLNFYDNVSIETDRISGNEAFNFISRDSIGVNKLNVQYIHLPLELRFRSDPNTRGDFFRLYVGGKIGVRVNSYARMKTDVYNIQYNDLGSLNRFMYGVYTRIGYSFFSVYAYYGLSEMFEKQVTDISTEPPLHLNGAKPLCVGISLSL